MFYLATLILLYSFSILFLGIRGELDTVSIISCTIFHVIAFLGIKGRDILKSIKKIYRALFTLSLIEKIVVALIVLQIVINLIGTFGPELAFDALWYHLTLPKIYLMNGKISFIPGGLLYYSAMPQLTEMLYIAALSIGNEVYAKCINLVFGILCLISLYKLSRLYVARKYALFTLLIFYSNLVVGWLSTTAYIDLVRTFYEILALTALSIFYKNKEQKYLILTGVMLGSEICTKLFSFGSLALFCIVIFIGQTAFRKEKLFIILKNQILLIFLSIIIPLPWFIYSFYHTHNPFYPLFSSIPLPQNDFSIFTIQAVIPNLWKLFMKADDPISPIYLVIFPLVLMKVRSFSDELKLIALYCLGGLVVWYCIPQFGGGRYILPYLPAFSLIVAYTISLINLRDMQRFILAFILFVSAINIGYRFLANKKYIPYIIGKESKATFLCKHLNFDFGDFYDCDGMIQKIVGKDTLLIHDIHNLYYVPVKFVHTSYADKNSTYRYFLTKNKIEDKKLKEVYENKKMKIYLYKRKNEYNKGLDTKF